MRVIALNGSPNRDGNTATLLNKVLEEISKEGIETKFIQLGGTNIHGCRACKVCYRDKIKKCAFDDDIFNDVMKEVLEADAMILGTPSYFSDMTPELKCFIDRAGFIAISNGRLFKNKIGAAVIAQRRAGGSAIQGSIHHMFLMNEMIIPGSTYWNFGMGMEKGEVANDREAMKNMANLGQNIVWLMKKII